MIHGKELNINSVCKLTLKDFLKKIGFIQFGKYAFVLRSKDLLNSNLEEFIQKIK